MKKTKPQKFKDLEDSVWRNWPDPSQSPLPDDEFWVVIGDDGKPVFSIAGGLVTTKLHHLAIGHAWWHSMGKSKELPIKRARVTVEILEGEE